MVHEIRISFILQVFLYCIQQIVHKCKSFQILTEPMFPLQDFYHSYYENHQSIWSMEFIPKLKDFTFAIEDQKKHQVVNEIIDAYKWQILPLFPEFQKGHYTTLFKCFNAIF